MEMSYIKQGEEALQKSLSILGDQDGWKTETVVVGSLLCSRRTQSSCKSQNGRGWKGPLWVT